MNQPKISVLDDPEIIAQIGDFTELFPCNRDAYARGEVRRAYVAVPQYRTSGRPVGYAYRELVF